MPTKTIIDNIIVQPKNDFTNDVLARELDEHKYFIRQLPYRGNRLYNIWSCPRWLVDYLVNSHTTGLDFKLYLRHKNGILRKWNRPRKKVLPTKTQVQITAAIKLAQKR